MITRESFPVLCDRCPESSMLMEWPHKAATKEEALGLIREHLATWGWRYIEDDDLCPACVARFVHEES